MRRGSACRQLHPFPTIQQVEQGNNAMDTTKQYVKKTTLTNDEILHNNEIYEDIIANEFPEEDMTDKSFRDKDKELALKSRMVKVLEEQEGEGECVKRKVKDKKLLETEELSFLLQSGI